MQRSTFRTTQIEIAESIGISDRTFRDGTKELESLGLIKIETQNLYKKGGGSDPCSYSPVFPKGYGKLYFKDDAESSGSKDIVQKYNPDQDI
jgi:predicted transcriptional regulator